MTRRRVTPVNENVDTDELRRLCEFFRREAGLAFHDGGAVLERKLRDRVGALRLPSFTAYLEYLRSDLGGREIEEAIELVTTHETYFFREEYQLRTFQNEVLPRLKAMAGGHPGLSFWSAGCSTGEEAYTVAMIAKRANADVYPPWDIRVVGTDISRRCVATARRGVYGASSFRAVPEEYKQAYFVSGNDVTHVAPEVRAMCSFAQLNLLDDARASFVGRVDAIFCRNVLIYLEPPARQRVLQTLYDHLAPGGYLMLGHAESLLNLPSPFVPVRFGDDLVYRRPEGEQPIASPRGRGEAS